MFVLPYFCHHKEEMKGGGVELWVAMFPGGRLVNNGDKNKFPATLKKVEEK